MRFLWGKSLPGWTFIKDPGSEGYYRMEDSGCVIILQRQLLGSTIMRLFLGGQLDVSVLEKKINRHESLLELLYLASKWIDEYSIVGQALLVGNGQVERIRQQNPPKSSLKFGQIQP